MHNSIVLVKNEWKLIMGPQSFQFRFQDVILADCYQDYIELIEYLRLNRVRRCNSCHIKLFNTVTNTTVIFNRREIQEFCLFVIEVKRDLQLIEKKTFGAELLGVMEGNYSFFEKQIHKN